MDLRPKLELAGSALMAILDPTKDLMPTGGYEAAHDLGRWWDAALRLEETIGFKVPAELEAASLRNLQRLTDNPDRLLMNRADVPWLKDAARINSHNFRETFLAYGGLIRRRQNPWAREAALELVRSLDRVLQADGSLDPSRLGSWGRTPYTDDPSHTEPRHGQWFDATATSGRALEALVWLYEVTDEPSVLALARRIAAHHLASSTHRDGRMREEVIDANNVGHNHSYHGTLRGLLLFGLLTGQKEYVETVEATYRRAVRHRLVLESGWAPHDLGTIRFPNDFGDPVSEPASTGDSAQLALWLALRAGCDDLLDDVERLVRARLVPTQLTETDVRAQPERVFALREIGAWCVQGPSHARKGCTPDVHAAVIHTLCDIQNHICTPTATGVRVNLHFNTEDDRLRIASTRGQRAVLTLMVRQPCEVLIRIPGWAPVASLKLYIDGAAHPLHRTGIFTRVPAAALKPGSEISLSYDLPIRHTEEIMPSGRSYRLQWRGDEITGINPQDQPMPIHPTLGA